MFEGMQDFNYLASNSFEVTLELGCDKYPTEERLEELWLENRKPLYEFMWQVIAGFARSSHPCCLKAWGDNDILSGEKYEVLT